MLDRQVSHVVNGQIMYIADGAKMIKSAGGNYYQWGVPIPPAKGSASDGGTGTGGVAAGVYRLVIVPTNFLGQMGNPWQTDANTDPISVTVVADSSSIDVTLPIHGDPQVRYMSVYRTKVDETAPYYYAGYVANGTTSLTLNGDDDALPTNDTLEAALPGSTTGAPPFKYGRPPAKMLAEMLGDVIFVAGEDEYNTGTLSATDASTVFTGVGTKFTKDMIGKTVKFGGEGIRYVISTVVSDTVLKTETAYERPPWRDADPSDESYEIVGDYNEVCPSEPGEPEHFNPLRRFNVGENEGGRIKGMKQYAGDIMMLTESNVYRVSPTYQASEYSVLTTNSQYGTVAPRSVIRAGGGLVFFSGEHLCMYQNADAKPFSDVRMGTLFRDSRDDMKRYAISAVVNGRLFFAFSYESEDYLDHIACYDFRGGTWDLWSGVRIVDMVSIVDQYGKHYLQFEAPIGDKYAIYMFTDAAFNDGFGKQDYSGTVVASGSTSVEVSATLPTSLFGVRGAKIRIASGTGAGQERWITENTASSVTVSEAWTTMPDSTSTYTIGQIAEHMESGRLTFGDPFVEKSVKNLEVSAGER